MIVFIWVWLVQQVFNENRNHVPRYHASTEIISWSVQLYDTYFVFENLIIPPSTCCVEWAASKKLY